MLSDVWYIQQIHWVVFMTLGMAVFGRNKEGGWRFFSKKIREAKTFFQPKKKGRRLFFRKKRAYVPGKFWPVPNRTFEHHITAYADKPFLGKFGPYLGHIRTIPCLGNLIHFNFAGQDREKTCNSSFLSLFISEVR